MTPRWALALQYVLVLALTLDVVGQLVGLVGDGSKDFLAVTALATLLLAAGRACVSVSGHEQGEHAGRARTRPEVTAATSTPEAVGRG